MNRIRTFENRPYILGSSFKFDTNGNPLPISKSRSYARNYAELVRRKGFNARVVDWVGGSGVYVGRRYNKTKAEARKDWLDELKDARFENAVFGAGIAPTAELPFLQNVNEFSVGGNALEAEQVSFQGGISRLEAMMQGSYFGGSGNNDVEELLQSYLNIEYESNKTELISELNSLSNQERTKIIKEYGDLESYLQYRATQKTESIEPIWANEMVGNDGKNSIRWNTPKRTGETGVIPGWSIEGRKGKSIFDIDTTRARWHVAIGWKTKEGWEEAPTYAFRNKESADVFAERIQKLGQERGELAITVDRNGNRTVLPYSNLDISVVKELGTDSGAEYEANVEETRQIIDSLNMPERGSALPKPDDIRDLAENMVISKQNTGVMSRYDAQRRKYGVR